MSVIDSVFFLNYLYRIFSFFSFFLYWFFSYSQPVGSVWNVPEQFGGHRYHFFLPVIASPVHWDLRAAGPEHCHCDRLQLDSLFRNAFQRS
jgi:hypothetical protein